MNLYDYLETELATFDEKPFSPVDSAALSQFCMVRGEGVAPGLRAPRTEGPLAHPTVDRLADRLHAALTRPARFADFLDAGRFEGMFSGLAPERVKQELSALVASPRFRDLEIRDYSSAFDEDAHVQFAAVTFIWRGPAGAGRAASGRSSQDDFAYVGFRGTDDSLTGWRENFDMAVAPPVPAQRMARDYLESVARHLPGRIFVGGHSKGGNLATYAALTCSDEVRARIERVFDHDGPGFKAGFVSKEDYDRLAGRIHRTVPEESVVGMLMETHAPTLVVRSTAHGLDQHSVFTWEIEGNDFAYADDLAASAKVTHETFAEWLAELPDEKAPAVVDALFRAIEASGATNAGDVFAGGVRGIELLAEAARNMDQETREVLVPELTRLLGIATRQGLAAAFTRR